MSKIIYFSQLHKKHGKNTPELKTLEWCISRLILDLHFFLISRLNDACFPLVINLQINLHIGINA